MKRFFAVSGAIAGIAVVLALPAGASAAVTHTVTTVNGLSVDRYSWPDSQGRTRTVSLKRQGAGNPGNGGYAIQMTYQTAGGQTVTANAAAGEGFGYFVSHERYRQFSNGTEGTIAGKIFGKDDSPLGRGFPVSGVKLDTGDPNKAAHRFRMTYPRYGTVAAGGLDMNGSDSPRLSLNAADYRLYELPVTLTWHFQSGTDYPAIRTQVGLSKLPGPNRASFDVRGPYGVLDFDQGSNALQRVHWGDRLHFSTTTAPLTRNSQWNWDQANAGARYTALATANHEMGLFEPRPYANSALTHGFAVNRGKTSAARADCGQAQILPCDWEWPYQSAQFSLPYGNNDGPTTGEKIAWGSTAYYGMNAVNSIWDGQQGNPFNGFPASNEVSYDTCIALGLTTVAGLTRTAAAGAYDCALPFAISDPGGGGGGGACETAKKSLGAAGVSRQKAKQALAKAKRTLKRLSSAKKPAKKKLTRAKRAVTKAAGKLKRATARYRAAKDAVSSSCS